MSFVEDLNELVAANAAGVLSTAPHWRRETLGSIAAIINGFAFSSNHFKANKGIPLVRIRDVVDGQSETLYDGPIPEGYWVNDGDLLVGMDGDFNCALWRGGKALLNQRVCKIVPDEARLRKQFLLYALPGYLALINDYTSSVTVKHLSSRTLKLLPLPLPDLDEQDRMIARIDALFAEIVEGEAALAEARAGVETYRKSLLRAAVTGELTAHWRVANPSEETGERLLQRILADRRVLWHADPKSARKKYVEPAGPDTSSLPELPKGWAWASLQQLGDFGRGKSKHRPRNDPKLYGGPYPFIQTGIVAESDGDINRYEQTYSEMGKSQSKLWPAGTLCITIAANIAKTGVLTFNACFPDSIVGLTCMPGVEPRYVELFIRTVREELDRWAPATAQKNINLETLYEVAVPLPPTTEQARIVQIAREETGLEATLEDAGLEALASTLRQSILAAAFRGELAA